ALLLFKLLGHAPILLHGSVERILVNAIGGGITLGSVLHHGVPVDAVELVPEVTHAMRLFAEENDDALDKKNWRLIHDDGRNWMQLTPLRYDVVTADATHPAAGESWPLYTREYYELVRGHLTERGVFAQWLPMHNMAEADFRAVLRTFREVFPHLLVLFANRYCVVLASEQPFTTDAATLTARIAAKPEVAEDLREFGIVRGEDVLKYVVLDTTGVERLTETAEILTDDHASVEFAELHRLGVSETFVPNLAMLAQSMNPEELARATGAPSALFRSRQRLIAAQLGSREPTIESAFAALGELQGARQEWPGDSDVDYATATIEGTIVRYLAQDYASFLSRPDFERFLGPVVGLAEAHADDPFLQQLAGTAYLRFERFGEALPFLERAANARPDDPTFLSNLAFTYDRLGRYDEALVLVRRLRPIIGENRAIEQFEADLERKAKGGTR
ncbi:MAG: fused MFS/spermidine synthase, partial [Candidatus Binatia bacterium]